MSEQASGVAFDRGTKTVLLIGEEAIDTVLDLLGDTITPERLSGVARSLVQVYKPEYNVSNDEQWCLGTDEDTVKYFKQRVSGVKGLEMVSFITKGDTDAV